MFETIQQSLADPLVIWGKIAEFLPSLFMALVLLVGGHIVAKLVSKGAFKLLNRLGIDRLAASAGLPAALVKASPSRLLSKIIYWLIFLTFLISASDTLGLDRVAATIDHFVLYLPKVISALILMLVGMFIAGFVRSGVEATLASMNLGYEKAIGNIIYALIFIIVLSLSISQLEIETDLLNQVVIIFLTAGAGALALALGLGTQSVASNVVAGVYAREMYGPGDRIKIGEQTGEVVEITSTALILQLDEGNQISIPNQALIEKEVEIIK